MNFFTTTCDVYRPFGAGAPTITGIPCRLVPNMNQNNRGGGGLTWTHYVDLPFDGDVRDGCTRAAVSPDVFYADGDEVRIGTVRYVVVWVELHNRGGTTPFRRAYLTRDTVTWPDL